MKENEVEIHDQRPNEEIILVRHMHPWVFAKTGMFAVLMTLIVVVSFLIWHVSMISIIILVFATIIAAVFGLIGSFQYNNTVFILTNMRIINISQPSLFNRKVQEMELGNIYNLQYSISGPIRSLLNFGNIEVTTLGNDANSINVINIENPHFIYEKISRAKEKITGRGIEEERKVIR